MKLLKITLCLFLLGVTLVADCPAIGADTDAQKQVKSGVTNPEEQRQRLEKLWADLEKPEPAASAALLKLGVDTLVAVPFLKQKMAPLKIDAAKVKVLLGELRSDKEEVWKAAAEQLAYFDPRLAIDLETLMKDVPDAPARQRLVEILSNRPAGSLAGKEITLRPVGADGFNFAMPGSWWAEHKVERLTTASWRGEMPKWTRAVRALVLLEHIGTPDATDIIKEMATGHPDAQPTRVAKEILGKGVGKSP